MDSLARKPGTSRPRTLLQGLLFGLSLPERLVRFVLGLLGSLARLLSFLIPRPIRETRFFKTAVGRQLRILTDVVGQAGLYRDAREVLDQEAAVRLGVGGTLDNILMVGLHVSPIWVMLAASDLCEGAKVFTRRLALELKDLGLMQEGSRLDSVDQVLEGLEKLSGGLAAALDKPPLKLQEMKKTVEAIKDELLLVTDTAVNRTARIEDLAQNLENLARDSKRSLFEVSTAVAVGTAEKMGHFVAGTVVGTLFTLRMVGETLLGDVLMNYVDTARSIHRRGYFASWARFTSPQHRSWRQIFRYSFLSWTETALTLGAYRKTPWARRP